MSATPNLLISLIAASQNNKEITANSAFDTLDEALAGNAAIAMSDADYTMTQATGLSAMFFKFTGTITQNRNVSLPTGIAKLYVVINDTTSSSSLSLIFRCGTDANMVVMAPGQAHVLYCDGIGNVIQCS